MDEDKQNTDFMIRIIMEHGLKIFKFILNNVPEPPSLVGVQGFHDVVKGDHLVYKTKIGWNIHFYVVENLGNGSLKVCGCFLEENDSLLIEEELIFKPVQAQRIRIKERMLHDANIPVQKLKKKIYENTTCLHDEKYRIDLFKEQRNYYNFFTNNSEHFINFVKTGQEKSQMAIEIDSFIEKHIAVQAILNGNTEMIKIIMKHRNWPLIILDLLKLILKQPSTELAIQHGLQNIFTEVAKTTTNSATKSVIVQEGAKAVLTQATKSVTEEVVEEGGKAIAAQATKSTAKEVVKEGGKATAAQATKSAAKEVVKEGGKAAATQATKSAAKEIMKEGGKDVTTQGIAKVVVQEVSKDALEEGGKAATNQAAKNAAKVVAQETSKEVLMQGTKSTTVQVAKSAASNAVKQTLKTTVIAGVVIEGVLYSVSMGKAMYKLHKNEMDHEEFIDFTVEQTATSGGSTAGGISGSLAGVAAGAAVGSVVPVIGTAIGATIGGIVGGIGGGVSGSLLGKGFGKLINFGRKSLSK